jgi:hypothetical protein
MRNIQQPDRHRRFYHRRLSITLIVICILTILGLAWVFVPGWIATTISSIIAISGVIVGLLQWLHPLQSNTESHSQETNEQGSWLGRVTSPLQEAIVAPPLIKRPPFDEELLIRPRKLVGRKETITRGEKKCYCVMGYRWDRQNSPGCCGYPSLTCGEILSGWDSRHLVPESQRCS